MRIVVIAATELEAAPCRAVVDADFVISGMGATNCAIATVQAIERYKPDLIVQIGIAGAIDYSIAIGEAVFVVSDFQADLGALRDGRFVPFETPIVTVENYTGLRGVAARSLNTACGAYVGQANAQIESMEGAAFFQAASLYSGLRFAQVRTISNYVDSARDEWQIQTALNVLPLALRICLNLN